MPELPDAGPIRGSLGPWESLWLGKGRLDTSDAEQAIVAKTILEILGLDITTVSDAREMLRLEADRRTSI